MVAKVSGKVLGVEAKESTGERKRSYFVVTLFSDRGARSEVFAVRVWAMPVGTKLAGQVGQSVEIDAVIGAYVDRRGKGAVVTLDVYDDTGAAENANGQLAGAAGARK